MKRCLVAAALTVAALAFVGAPTGAQSGAQTEAALAGAVSVDGGVNFSCALLGSGQVRCWGDNAAGQLGNDALGTDSAVPVPVRNVANTGNLAGATQLDVGTDHACARLSSGQAVCWGEGGASQLGDGGGLDRDFPVTVRNTANTAALTGITQITAGQGHACARLANGQARCWGNNSAGQIGNGAAPADAFTAQAVRNAGNTANLTGVVEIDAGEFHTCARLNTGQARCWGDSDSGRLGNNAVVVDRDLPVVVRNTNGAGALSGVTQLSTGGDHTCARLANGQARCWGDGVNGELGDGTDIDSPFPGAVTTPGGDANLAGVTSIHAGDNSTCARLGNGQARCWGDGDAGRLGNGIVQDSDFPVIVRNLVDSAPLRNVVGVIASMGDHSCAVLSNQQVRCWGDNDSGQLGNDDNPNDSPLPVAVQVSP